MKTEYPIFEANEKHEAEMVRMFLGNETPAERKFFTVVKAVLIVMIAVSAVRILLVTLI
jgi:hypothetical protein